MRDHKTVKHPGRDISQLVKGKLRSENGLILIHDTLDGNVKIILKCIAYISSIKSTSTLSTEKLKQIVPS